MRLRRIAMARYLSVFGDCDRCGHSIIYHTPVMGCLKCSCPEYMMLPCA